MKDSFKKAVRNVAFAGGLLALSACSTAPSAYYSEGQNYNGYRTQIQQMPTNCTIRTQRNGQVIGGHIVYDAGTAREVCVASNNANQRVRGSNPVGELRNQTQQMNNTVRAINNFGRTLNQFGEGWK